MYRICRQCIMDTSDLHIRFDETGKCDHCENYERNILPNWHTDKRGEDQIMPLIEKIRRDGKGRDHDCIIGLSGGLDSSYLAHVVTKKFGLRPMIFHVDAGWNTQQAVSNVEKLVDGLKLDLYTEVVDWEEMRDLQLAFFRSQVADQDVPQDLAFFSALYNYSVTNKFSYIITGGNYSTECVREPLEWGGYYATDMKWVNAIHRQFGKRPLGKMQTADIFRYKLVDRFVHGIKMVKLLNNVPYVKQEAEKLLAENYGWESFQHKHHESRFTRFYESYWLPKKFGFEKRRAHFSSLILTGQMKRQDALDRISRPELPDDVLRQEFEYVAKKLDVSTAGLNEIFDGANKNYRNYPNRHGLITMGTRILQFIGVEKRRFK
ncbi:MAG: N-acetyl sugar amidotransferase [Lacunisphaera sp.]